MVTQNQLQTFRERGVLRLEGLLSDEAVLRAREAVLRPLARRGLWQNGAWHLDAAPRREWSSNGVGVKVIGNKHPEVELLLKEPSLLEAADALLEGRAFDQVVYKRPQVLVTLPNAKQWTVPTGWHVDFPRLPSGDPPGIQLFAFFDFVEAYGGGTLVVAGSHLLLNEYRFIRNKEINGLLGKETFFRKLLNADPARPMEERAHLLNETGSVDGISLELVELTGAPGDAYFMDLRMLHTGAPNAANHPRMMITHRFVRADLIAALAEGFGWRKMAQHSN